MDREELASRDEGPVLMPFCRPLPVSAEDAAPAAARQDGPAPMPGPHRTWPAKDTRGAGTDQRHVQ